MLALDHMPGKLASIRKKLRQTHLLDHHISMHHWQLSSFVVVIETRISVRQFFICPMVSKGTSENFPESERTPHTSHLSLQLTQRTSDLQPCTLGLRPEPPHAELLTSDLRLQVTDLRPQTSHLNALTSDLTLHISEFRPQTSELRPSDLRPQCSNLRPPNLRLRLQCSHLRPLTSARKRPLRPGQPRFDA